MTEPRTGHPGSIYSAPNRVEFCDMGMGRRLLSLLLFVAGYLLLATLEPLVAAGPALTSFVAATMLLARVSEPARI